MQMLATGRHLGVYFSSMGKKVRVVRVIDVTEMGRAGGRARAANLSAEELSAIGKAAAEKRWRGHVAKRPASSRKKKATK